jgi:hypothetical protein
MFEREFFEKRKVLEQLDYEKSIGEIRNLYQQYSAPYKYIDTNKILAIVDKAERSIENSKVQF